MPDEAVDDVDGGVEGVDEAVADLLGEPSAEDSPEDVAAADTSEDEAADLPDEQAEEETADPDQTELQKLIASKGGTKKFLESVHAGFAQRKNLDAELSAIKTKLSKLVPDEAQPPDALPAGIDKEEFDWVQSQLQAKASKAESIEKRQTALVTTAEQVKYELASLEGELKRADEYDAVEIKNQINARKAQLEQMKAEYIRLAEDLDDNSNKSFELKQRMKSIQRQIEEAKADHQVQQEEQQAFYAKTISDFNGSVAAVAKALEIPKGKSLAHFEKIMRAQLMAHFSSLPPDAPAVDIPKFIRDAAAEYAEAQGLDARGSLASLTQKKLATQRTVQQGRPAVAAPQAPKGAWTADYARSRAAKILG